MNLHHSIAALVKEKIKEMSQKGLIPDGDWEALTGVEVPANTTFGDYATNAAMVIARQAKTNPRQVAEVIQKGLKEIPQIKEVTIAGPGFINMVLTDQAWDTALATIIVSGPNYGNSTIGQNKKINLEYLSANPTGPLHVGHTRGAIYGDVLGRLLHKIGYDVTTEYYINDYGNQIDTLSNSLFWRYQELFGLHQGETMPEGQYPGDYLIPAAQLIKDKDGDAWLDAPFEKRDAYFKETAVREMMALIKGNLKDLGITFDVYTSEKKLVESGQVDQAMQMMQDMGLLYEGTLPKPQGEEVDEDWESQTQLLFRATDFGDDVDRVVVRADGRKTYFASDIANHYSKYQRGFDHMIDIFGADHGGYVKRMKAAVQAFSDGKATLDVDLCQIVNLEKDGKPFKMSKRAGNFILVPDILEEIDADAFRLFMLTKSAHSQMTFDLAKAKEKTKDNPVFYIQYAHARACSVLRIFDETFHSSVDPDQSDYASLNAAERELVRTLCAYPSVVEAAGTAHAPHLLTSYLEDVARQFHSLWTMGARAGERFVDKDKLDVSNRNVVLVESVKRVIANGLWTIGVTPMDKMDSIKETDGSDKI